jgi:hypothetical protein
MEVNKNNHPKIDSVFQKTVQTSHADQEDEALAMWDNGFKQKIVKQNFFTFGLRHFNVYILSGIVLIAVFILVVVYSISKSDNGRLKYGSGSNNIGDTSGNKHRDEVKQGDIGHGIYNTNNTINADKNKKPRLSTYQRSNGSIPNDTIKRNTLPSKQLDEMVITQPKDQMQSTITDNRTNTRKDSLAKKEKKIIYLEKADTLHVVDTIRSKRAWKRLNRNK